MSFKIPEKYIDDLIEKSDVDVFETHTTTIVALTLPNGFTIVDSSGCIDPKEYNKELGIKNAMTAIKRKVWQLEGYRINDCVCDVVK